jgi:hypothetical protein
MNRFFSAIMIAVSLAGCADQKQKHKEFNYNQEIPVSADTSVSTSCPYLTKDQYGNPVLSWIKEINDTTSLMCYSVSTDQGRTFGKAIEILPSENINPHGENLPKILFKPNGEIIAMWGAANPGPKSKYSGLVFYSQSFDNGKSWTKETALVKDTSAYDQRYFDLDLSPDGEAMVVWLDNRGKKDKEGSTLFFASTKGKNGFKDEKAIGETCCQCCRTDLFTDKKGNIHVSYRDIINDSIRDMVHTLSTDGGQNFSIPVRISADNWVINGCPHTGPAMAENNSGLHFAWYTMGTGQGVFYCNSYDSGKSFSKKDTVSTQPSAKHPQLTTLSNGNIVILWDEMRKKEESFYGCIGMQIRNNEGRILFTKYISEERCMAEFPVVSAMDRDQVIVAYNKQGKGRRKEVVYKILKVTEQD